MVLLLIIFFLLTDQYQVALVWMGLSSKDSCVGTLVLSLVMLGGNGTLRGGA